MTSTGSGAMKTARLKNDDHGLRLGSDDDRRPRRWARADADTVLSHRRRG